MSAGILAMVLKDTLDLSEKAFEKEVEITGNIQWVCFKSMNESQRLGGSAIYTTNNVSHEHKFLIINTILNWLDKLYAQRKWCTCYRYHLQTNTTKGGFAS